MVKASGGHYPLPMPKLKDKPTKAGKAAKAPFADTADKYLLYGLSVQEPTNEVEFFNETYEKRHGRSPRILREDFCGTHAICCEWVKHHQDNTAIGVDLDPEPLAWGKANPQAALTDEQRGRITLIQDDVRLEGEVKADVLAAQNFSFFIFKTRDELRGYFEKAYANLAEGGIMVMDMMGGSECIEEDHHDIRTIEVDDADTAKRIGYKKFKYVWEQHSFNPITADALFHIHFRFKDGSRLNKAFTYAWRFWTLPELRELLTEAGFKDVTVYWEGEDEDGEGNGEFTPATVAASDPSWIAYIVANK